MEVFGQIELQTIKSVNMKLKRTIESITEKEAVHCPTEAQAIAFCQMLKAAGKTWCGGESYDTTNWDVNKEDTVYDPNSGMYGNLHLTVKDEGYTITDVSEFLPDAGEVAQETQLEPHIQDYRALLSVISKVNDTSLQIELMEAAFNAVMSYCRAGMAVGKNIYRPNANPEKSEQ